VDQTDSTIEIHRISFSRIDGEKIVERMQGPAVSDWSVKPYRESLLNAMSSYWLECPFEIGHIRPPEIVRYAGP
jgi:hypothetical protein